MVVSKIRGMDNSSKFFLLATGATAIVGIVLTTIGFVLRFGGGLGAFTSWEEHDEDFLELKRLDLIFGMYTACGIVLILSFIIALIATVKENPFLLRMYCGIIGLMVVIQLVTGLLAFSYADQINQLASDDILLESLGKAQARYVVNQPNPPNDPETNFWVNTQKIFSCCGVKNRQDWSLIKDDTVLSQQYNCYQANWNTGCEKLMRDRVSNDATYMAVSAMGVVVVEIIASFLGGYRAYNLAHPDAKL